jgi:putative chitinase
MLQLTPHFSLGELRHSDTALRLGIDNTPSKEVVANARLAAMGMEKIRAVLGAAIFVHSWFRCEALERVLCKKDFDAWCFRHGKNIGTMELLDAAWREYFRRKGHPQGWCIDFTAPNFGTPRQIVRTIKDSDIRFDQLIEEGTWCHASFDPRMRGEVLLATFKDGTPTYTAGVS